MDLSGVIASLSGGKTYTVKRRAAGTYGPGGRLVAGATSTFTVKALVTPMGGQTLERLSEGMRTSEKRQVFTKTPLKIAGGGFEPDLLTFDGFDWEVESLEDWAGHANFYRAVVAKVGA